MATEYAPSAELPSGLDREPMHAYPTLSSRNDNHNQALHEPDSPSMRRRLRHVSQRIAAKLHESKVEPVPLKQKREPTAPTLAPQPTQDTHNLRFAEEGEQKSQLPAFKEFVHQPLDTLKSVVHKQGGKEFADAVASTDATHGAGVKLVLAHERVSAELEGSQGKADAAKEFASLKKVRQDAFVRWTLARHVRRVNVIPPEPPPRCRREDFIMTDDQTGKERMHWAQYGEHLLTRYTTEHANQYVGASSELPDPTAEALSTSFERVLLTSVPVQNGAMKLMSIAFWESPMETAAYALLYFILCVFNYVTRAIILFYLFSVLKAKYYPPTIPALREKLERSEDASQTAQDLNELIEQHGSHGWVDALTEKAGPTIQLLLEDVADYMEITKNFSEWRDPRRTRNTLIELFVLWVFITFTPVWLLVKFIMFGIGVLFFAVIPISHRWPQYRLLVNPLTWLFWKVPTHGQWAIARLQAEAKEQLSQLLHGPATDSNKDEVPFIGPLNDPSAAQDTNSKPGQQCAERQHLSVGRYRGVYSKTSGTLCLDVNGMHFETATSSTRKWALRYDKLKSLRKVSSLGSNTADEDILVIDADGHEYRISALKQRNEVFTQVVGYSGIQWQITG